MNHEILKQVIYDQHDVIRSSEIVEREYFFEPNANYVLTGLRRAGKSMLLYRIVQKLIAQGAEWNQIIFVNFEDERLAEFDEADFNDILEVKNELTEQEGYFFFDEIQNIDGWEKFARRLADYRLRVYLTGSNAKMLSKDIERRLGGRYLSQIITPYNFREYLAAQDVTFDQEALLKTRTVGRIKGVLEGYLTDGGFPESLLYQTKRTYVESIYQKILLGDIVARNGIRNEQAMRVLMKKIAETIRNPISYSKLHNTLKTVGFSISKMSLIDYISYAKDAFLIFDIRNYFASFSERESIPKYYYGDNGLVNLFLVGKASILLENLVAVCLWARHADGLYYLKSPKTGIDVDFYIPQEGTAIQVAWSIRDDAREREIRNLVKLAQAMEGIRRLVIVTREEEETIEANGQVIEVIPLYRFLLQEA